MYWRLQVRLRCYEQGGVRRGERIWSSAGYMILVIVFCWTPALVLIGFSFVCSETDRLFPLFIIQAVSVSLHGFLNSIVYAWRRRNFREAVLRERMPLLTYTHRAFFDQSLRNDTEETGSA
ncbi:cannabinoid receptor 2-like [Neoarius graeffei]|uniref:cannabinoid receptor 2-like n=1 Tax=Neoarius graeffei TaxID=443677 RepID=UPI00298C01D9|nr:cannabinoid receptor 2-like [Neoarius graeffei]